MHHGRAGPRSLARVFIYCRRSRDDLKLLELMVLEREDAELAGSLGTRLSSGACVCVCVLVRVCLCVCVFVCVETELAVAV